MEDLGTSVDTKNKDLHGEIDLKTNAQPLNVAVDSTFLKNYREDKIFSESVTNCYPYFTFINDNQSAIFSVASNNDLYMVYEDDSTEAGWASLKLIPSLTNVSQNPGLSSQRPFVVVKDAKNLTHIFAITSDQRIWHVFQNDIDPTKWPSGPLSDDICVNKSGYMWDILQAVLAADGNIHVFFLNDQSSIKEVREIYQQDGDPKSWFASLAVPIDLDSLPFTRYTGISVGKDSSGSLEMSVKYDPPLDTNKQVFLSAKSGAGSWTQRSFIKGIRGMYPFLTATKYLENVSAFFLSYGAQSFVQLTPSQENFFDLPIPTPTIPSDNCLQWNLFGFANPITSKIELIKTVQNSYSMGQNIFKSTVEVAYITQNADSLVPDDPNVPPNPQNVQNNWNVQLLGDGTSALYPPVLNYPTGINAGSVVQHVESGGLLHVFFIDSAQHVNYIEQGKDGWRPVADLDVQGIYLSAKIDAEGFIELFVLDTQSNPMILRRGADGAWQKEMVEVDDPGTVQTYDSFYVNVTLSDANNAPLPNQSCDIWADSPIAIKINGKTYHVDTNQKVTVSTNAMSKLTLEMETFNLGAPAIYLSTPSMDPGSKISILVQEDIQQQMNSATASGTALLNVQKPDGTYLVSDPSIRGDATTVNAVAEALNQMTSLKNANVRNAYDGQPKIRVNGKAGAYYHPPGDKTLPGQLVSAANAKPWKLSFENGKAVFTFLTQAEFDTYMSTAKKQKAERTRNVPSHWIAKKIRKQPHLVSPDSWWDDIVDWFEEAWDDVTSGIAELATIVMDGVNAVVNLVIDGVTYALDFVIDTVEKVVDAVVGVLAKIKVFIQDVIQWLEFIFDWDDILLVKEAIKYSFNQGLTAVQLGLDYLNNESQSFFDTILTKLQDAESTVASTFGSKSVYQIEEKDSSYEKSFSNNIIVDYLVNSGSITALSLGQTVGPNVQDDFLAELQELVKTFQSDATYKEFADELTQLISSLSMPSDFFNKCMPTLIELVFKIASASVSLLKNTFNIVMRALASIVGAIQEFFNADIGIPFLDVLYRFISGSSPSILDMLALGMAIPVTLLYKITFNKAPIPNQDALNQFESASTAQILLANRGITLTKEDALLSSSIVLTGPTDLQLFQAAVNSIAYALSGTFSAMELSKLSSACGLVAAITNYGWVPPTQQASPGFQNSASMINLLWTCGLASSAFGIVCMYFDRNSPPPPPGEDTPWGYVNTGVDTLIGFFEAFLSAEIISAQKNEGIYNTTNEALAAGNFLSMFPAAFKSAKYMGKYGLVVEKFLNFAGNFGAAIAYFVSAYESSSSGFILKSSTVIEIPTTQFLSMTQQILETQVRILMRLDSIENRAVSRAVDEDKLQMEQEWRADTLYSEGKSALMMYKREGSKDTSKLQEAMAKFRNAKDQYKGLLRTHTFFENPEAANKAKKRIEKTSNEGKYAMATLIK